MARVAGSNPTEGMDGSSLVFVARCVGSGVCDELITHSGESYSVCVCVCVFAVCGLETSLGRPGPEFVFCPNRNCCK